MSAEGPNVQRRLAAVLAADVVGYSRLMEVDEAGTLARLKTVRLELIDPAITNCKGRIIKTTGDGLLVEFQSVTEALRCGVRGYVLKSQAARDLVQAIEGVCRGEVYLSPGVAGAVAEAYLAPQHAAAALSVRERQVLQLIAEGHSTKAIAARLAISAKTVESHRSKLMQKLDIHDTASLVRYAIRHGVTQA